MDQWRRQDFSLEGAALRRRGGGEAPKAPNFLTFSLEMAHFYAYLRYSDVLILFCCPCRYSGLGREIFDYLILKWRILMHISDILYRPTYSKVLLHVQ